MKKKPYLIEYKLRPGEQKVWRQLFPLDWAKWHEYSKKSGRDQALELFIKKYDFLEFRSVDLV
jgi:hypothetical protein